MGRVRSGCGCIVGNLRKKEQKFYRRICRLEGNRIYRFGLDPLLDLGLVGRWPLRFRPRVFQLCF